MGDREVDNEGNLVSAWTADQEDGSFEVSTDSKGNIFLTVNDGGISTCKLESYEAKHLGMILLAMAGQVTCG